MPNQNKILLKQTILLVSISVLFFLLGLFAGEDDEPLPLIVYGLFYIYFWLMIIFFVPTSVFYFLRIKNYIKLIGLNITFKVLCWILISPLLALFVLGMFESFYLSWSEASFFTNTWVSIKLINIEEIINFLYYTPALIFAGLLYWAVRINKSFSIYNNQKLIK